MGRSRVCCEPELYSLCIDSLDSVGDTCPRCSSILLLVVGNERWPGIERSTFVGLFVPSYSCGARRAGAILDAINRFLIFNRNVCGLAIKTHHALLEYTNNNRDNVM